MEIAFATSELPQTGTVVVLAAGSELTATGTLLDQQTGGALQRAIEMAGTPIKRGKVIDLLCPSGLNLARLVVLGTGDPAEVKRLDLDVLGGSLATKLKGLGVTEAHVAIDPVEGLSFRPAEVAVGLAEGALLRSYSFEKYRTTEQDDEKNGQDEVKKLTLHLAEPEAAEAGWSSAAAVARGVAQARDLVSEPANVLSPEEFAEACRTLGEQAGMEVEVLGPSTLRDLGMNALLAVGQGSMRESRVAVMQWKGGPPDQPPVALVGKGVCFDSGGLSLKPAGGMEEMKWDMGGAGAVFGAMAAIAGRKAKTNVVGVLGLSENMPSGHAQRPGDVIKAMSGLTIEVVNTDAEGRLLLADVLHYTKDRFKPRAMIDLATLTGAIIVALGHEHAGLFSSDDTLAEQLTEAGAAVGEKLWRMPLGDDYAKHIKSDIADIKNVGRARQAGATAGAVFLQRFVGDVPWAHLDIAGVAWSKRDLPLAAKGATGFGVRLLDHLVAEHFED